MARKDDGSSMESVRERHLKYFRAVSSPLRRDILKALEEGELTMEVLRSRTNLDCKTLEWHLDVLEQASCLERDSRGVEVIYRITQQGRIVDRLE